MTYFADALQAPTNLEFGVFMGCLVALILMISLVLSVIQKTRDLFFHKEQPADQRPVTDQEFEARMSRMEADFNGKIIQLKTDLLTEISRPNLNYVTQAQLEQKLDKLETALNRKIDEGGVYAHQREHAFNNTLQMVQLKLAEIGMKLGMANPLAPRRGPRDTTGLASGEDSP